MADEEELPGTGDGEEPEEEVDATDEQPQAGDEDAAGPADADPDEEPGGWDADAPESFEPVWADPPGSAASVDVYKLGTITLHHPERDIVVLMDWGAARRLLKIYEQRRENGLADVLSLSTSRSQSGWVVCDLDEFVAVSWMPGLPKKPARTTIDPVVDQAA